MNKDIGMLINSSRGIIYASSEKDFAIMASEKAMELKNEMETLLDGFI
jgi:orotidine-5'-phosphate decarboxylase